MKKSEVAEMIIENLPEFSQYAAEEARIWENYGKCRIYFGRKHIEILEDGVVDVTTNPYAISELIMTLDGLTVKDGKRKAK